jgi:hypothetical protein
MFRFFAKTAHSMRAGINPRFANIITHFCKLIMEDKLNETDENGDCGIR